MSPTGAVEVACLVVSVEFAHISQLMAQSRVQVAVFVSRLDQRVCLLVLQVHLTFHVFYLPLQVLVRSLELLVLRDQLQDFFLRTMQGAPQVAGPVLK